jgi:glycerol-3-phosphate dehydrogenase
MQTVKTQVLIIGGGVTGAGIARDLALRGVNCVIVEKHDINAGASGANHGLLHSGARYIFSDAHSAEECRDEGRILKKMAPDCIEDTGGLFVAVAGDDETYITEFPHLCAKSHIPVKELDVKEAREMEPALSSKTIAAFQVQDASIGPFKLSMENIHQARSLGCDLLRHSQVVGFQIEKQRITATKLRNLLTQENFMVEADQVVNSSGAWAKEIAALAGCQIDLLYSKGSLLVTHNRLTERVINRLRPSSNADILVPGGTVSILGTTSIRIDNLDAIFPTVKEMDAIVGEGAAMIPELEKIRYIRAYAGVRPLVGSASEEGGRHISRSFTLNRLMAEKTTDLVCARLGVTKPCVTRTEPLPTTPATRWTQPGITPKLWMEHNDPDDLLLCECEMVPKSVVNSLALSIHEQNGKPDLVALGLRSRIGKGTCQGTFCAQRIAAYLYDIDEMAGKDGLENIRAFVSERWRGERPLLWDTSLIQAELKEALYCGLFGVELND